MLRSGLAILVGQNRRLALPGLVSLVLEGKLVVEFVDLEDASALVLDGDDVLLTFLKFLLIIAEVFLLLLLALQQEFGRSALQVSHLERRSLEDRKRRRTLVALFGHFELLTHTASERLVRDLFELGALRGRRERGLYWRRLLALSQKQLLPQDFVCNSRLVDAPVPDALDVLLDPPICLQQRLHYVHDVAHILRVSFL